MAKVISVLDIEELANKLCGTNHEETDDIESAVYEKYDIDLGNLTVLVRDLFNLVTLGISPLTNTPLIGFANEKDSFWLMKKDVTNQFIGNVILWLTEGESLDEKPQGFIRTILVDEKPKYDIVIRKALVEHQKSIDNGCNVACGESYCDENGCVNRKRNLIEPIDNSLKEISMKFIDWARDCGEDSFYIFENTDEAIERFFKESESQP